MKEVLLDHIDIRPENIHTFSPDVTKEDMFQRCKAYEKAIEDDGGIDLAVCEIGAQGSLAFNEPAHPTQASAGSCFSATRLATT